MIPDRVTFRNLSFPEWNLHFIVPTHEILRRPDESLPCAHLELVLLLKNRLCSTSDEFPVLLDSALGTCDFSLQQEALYGPDLDDEVFDGWKGSLIVRHNALLL